MWYNDFTELILISILREVDYMKFEKINSSQIKCSLTKTDLEEHNIHELGDLFYRTQASKELFDDIMEQASSELGFDISGEAIKVEAIPVSRENIEFIITKIENISDLRELDPRFSKFTDYDTDGEADDESEDSYHETAAPVKPIKLEGTDDKERIPYALFRFTSWSDASKAVKPFYDSAKDTLRPDFIGIVSRLYKSDESEYFLVIGSPTEDTRDAFNKICNALGERGQRLDYNPITVGLLSEHHTSIASKRALEILAKY